MQQADRDRFDATVPSSTIAPAARFRVAVVLLRVVGPFPAASLAACLAACERVSCESIRNAEAWGGRTH